MNSKRTLLISTVVMLLALLTAAVILAQDSTQEPSPEGTEVPTSFNDNRINGDIYLSGLALYCEDETGNTDTNTFQNGGLSVWGVGGQRYIHLTVDQLRGDEEIIQPPPEVTAEPVPATPVPAETADPMATEEPLTEPVLLARATTMTGGIWLFRVGEDTFVLQGTDEYGKFYTYTWMGCSLGVLTTDTAPLAGLEDMGLNEDMMATEEPMPMPMPTEEATEAM